MFWTIEELPVMHVLPVMDIQLGLVVRGVAGERHQYRPIQSRIAANSDPKTVAKALQDTFGFRELYVADLDAIGGGPPNFAIYDAVINLGFQIILDAGVSDSQRAESLNRFATPSRRLSGIVIGLESIVNEKDLLQIASRVEPELALFSLDLKLSRPLTRNVDWQSVSPLEIADIAIAHGFRRFIVLDLAAVGVGKGPTTLTLCKSLRKAHPNIELMSGGGIRSVDDIHALVDAGCNRVLVASALHDGKLTKKDIGE